LACVRSCIVIFSSGLGRMTTGNEKGQKPQCSTSGSRPASERTGARTNGERCHCCHAAGGAEEFLVLAHAAVP
jgi:hypothetical protein